MARWSHGDDRPVLAYVTEDEITRRRAQRVEFLLASLPGLQVDSSGVVRVDRGRTSLFGDNCADGVQLLIDGVVVGGSYTLRNISPSSLRGIEVYRRIASTPVELRAHRAQHAALWRSGRSEPLPHHEPALVAHRQRSLRFPLALAPADRQCARVRWHVAH